ncbi:hypothetical protein BLOT_014269 [Blomia tropicalis]|nr:hypothetical protein BLOT_014269 [Blomia tropicalis]
MKIQQKQEIGTSATIMEIGRNRKGILMIIKVDKSFKLRLNSSTQNVRRMSLNFDNFMLPIHHRVNMNFISKHNDEIRSSNRVKCIIMSRDALSKPVLYRQILALKQ